jgi:hypothetical protein
MGTLTQGNNVMMEILSRAMAAPQAAGQRKISHARFKMLPYPISRCVWRRGALAGPDNLSAMMGTLSIQTDALIVGKSGLASCAKAVLLWVNLMYALSHVGMGLTCGFLMVKCDVMMAITLMETAAAQSAL